MLDIIFSMNLHVHQFIILETTTHLILGLHLQRTLALSQLIIYGGEDLKLTPATLLSLSIDLFFKCSFHGLRFKRSTTVNLKK